MNARRIVDGALAALRRSTGLAGAVVKSRGGERVVRIGRGREARRFAFEAKAVDRFETPAQVKANLSGRRERPLLAAVFIGRETAARCRGLRLSFVDMAGNAYLEAPGLYVYVTGRPRRKQEGAPRFRAVSAAGLRVSFALLCRPELAGGGCREIARAAGTALGGVTAVMRDLEARGLVSRAKRRLLEPRRLLEEWVTHYPVRLRPKLGERRFAGAVEVLRQADLRSLGAYWGGEAAAQRLTGLVEAAAFTIYAGGPAEALVAALGLREDADGNVEILEKFWEFAWDGEQAGVAPAVLVYADLMGTGVGGVVEAGKGIYERYIENTFREHGEDRCRS